jgi:prepilin-type N-terminal cleavage/methylation domain-containing protein
MFTPIPADRRGITLIEVMISIGILAVGLTSVLSLIPAGKSEVSKAIVYDRASALAANALADAATFGLLKPGSLAWSGSTMAVFDPAAGAAWPGAASLKRSGIFSGSTSAGLAAGNQAPVLKLIAQGRDDVSYNAPATDDALPTNQFPTIGPRAFQGRMSCVIAVTSTATLSPGRFATLSAIVFHNRDLSSGGALTVSGSWDGSSAITAISLPSDRTLRDVVRPGTVITTGTSFHQLAMAAIDDSSGAVYVTFSGASPSSAGTVQILLDSVGLAEQTVMLEGPGPWSQ